MSAINLHAVVVDVVSQLTAAGLRATADPREVNPPCVLVGPPTPENWTLTTTCEVYLVPLTALVPNTGRLTALAALDAELAKVVDTFGQPDTCFPSDFVGASGGDPLPGYALSYSFHHKEG